MRWQAAHFSLDVKSNKNNLVVLGERKMHETRAQDAAAAADGLQADCGRAEQCCTASATGWSRCV